MSGGRKLSERCSEKRKVNIQFIEKIKNKSALYLKKYNKNEQIWRIFSYNESMQTMPAGTFRLTFNRKISRIVITILCNFGGNYGKRKRARS